MPHAVLMATQWPIVYTHGTDTNPTQLFKPTINIANDHWQWNYMETTQTHARTLRAITHWITAFGIVCIMPFFKQKQKYWI